MVPFASCATQTSFSLTLHFSVCVYFCRRRAQQHTAAAQTHCRYIWCINQSVRALYYNIIRGHKIFTGALCLHRSKRRVMCTSLGISNSMSVSQNPRNSTRGFKMLPSLELMCKKLQVLLYASSCNQNGLPVALKCH